MELKLQVVILAVVLVTIIEVSMPVPTTDKLGDDDIDSKLAEEFEETLLGSSNPIPEQPAITSKEHGENQGGEEDELLRPQKPLQHIPEPSPSPGPEHQGFTPTKTKPLKLEPVLGKNDACNCVKYFLCDVDNGGIVENGDVVGLIDIRLGGATKGPCGHYLKTCCKQMKPTSDILPSGPEFQHSVCGKRNDAGVGFRITGALEGESQFGEFPWMGAIVRKEKQGAEQPVNIFVCGGSLIHPKVLLTAAHCVFGKNPSDLMVRLGEWDTQTQDELWPHVERHVSKIVVHEDYFAGALYNDVALLFLDDDVKFAPNIDTVCLPPPNVNFDGQRCFASGWGKNSFGEEGKYQVILKRLDLPIVPTDHCQESLRKTRLGPYFKLHDSFVCAGGEQGRDTCRGDGGSPLVCKLPNSNHYVQYGIVAWGIGCGENGTPGVYVNIQKFVPWIERKLIAASFDTKYYKST